MITPFFHLDCFIIQPIEKMMESFKEKFKIAKVLASIFTHSSTPERKKTIMRGWMKIRNIKREPTGY